MSAKSASLLPNKANSSYTCEPQVYSYKLNKDDANRPSGNYKHYLRYFIFEVIFKKAKQYELGEFIPMSINYLEPQTISAALQSTDGTLIILFWQTEFDAFVNEFDFLDRLYQETHLNLPILTPKPGTIDKLIFEIHPPNKR